MIKKNTVFILGAGASVDFGYPIGEELRTSIYHNLKSKNVNVDNIARVFSETKTEFEDYTSFVTKFADDLLHSADYTIDSFLERFQKNYLQIGKIAIAQVLIKKENSDNLFLKDNWYRILWNKIKKGTSIDNITENKVSFITFNYDRSLEYFLHTVLSRYSEGITDSQVLNTLKSFPIIHLYGQLDPLPWQNRIHGRKYGELYNLNKLKSYLDNLSIIFENTNKNIENNFNAAKELLHDAERVYILGFGFHPINIERLSLITNNIRFSGTCYNLDTTLLSSIPDLRINSGGIEPAGLAHYPDANELYRVSIYDFITKHALIE